MSVSSARSRGSHGVYRKVAHTSQVDESLFGERRAVLARKAASGDSVSRSKILALTGRRSLTRSASGSGAPAAAVEPELVVIRASDVARMKKAAVIKTPADLKREAAEADAAKAERMARARERKDRILALEEQRKRNIPLTTLQQEEKEKNDSLLVKATHLRDESRDDVKTLNSYAEYAKTVTIRNKQVAEKKEREAREKEAERIRDLEMEIERLEMMKLYHDRERKQRDGLVAARKHIEIQMEERAKEREAEAKALREEQRKAKEEIKRQEQVAREEARIALERKAKQREEVLVANAAAVAAKRREHERELEEDAKIAEYIKQEEEKKRLADKAEEERIAAKELEFAKMRAQQEKIADGRAELDALRARRAFEAGQREERRKEMEAAKKRKALQDELVAARIEQQQRSEMLAALEIQRERAEFERNAAVRAEWMAKEEEAAQAVREANRKHKESVVSHISEREVLRRKEREEYLKEGHKTREELDADLEAIRRIRERKVAELVEAGVDPLYTVELGRYDPHDRISKDYKLGGRVPTIG